MSKKVDLQSVSIADGGSGYVATPTSNLLRWWWSWSNTLQVDIQSIDGNITSSGSGYTAGTYNNVSFTGGSPTEQLLLLTLQFLVLEEL